MSRAFWLVLLVVSLILTLPIALLGVCAGVLVAACERWLLLVGKLGARVGWWRR